MCCRCTRQQLARDSWVVFLGWRYQTILLGSRLETDFFDFASAATRHFIERLLSGKYGADKKKKWLFVNQVKALFSLLLSHNLECLRTQ